MVFVRGQSPGWSYGSLSFGPVVSGGLRQHDWIAHPRQAAEQRPFDPHIDDHRRPEGHAVRIQIAHGGATDTAAPRPIHAADTLSRGLTRARE